jgi:hypothetical protein
LQFEIIIKLLSFRRENGGANNLYSLFTLLYDSKNLKVQPKLLELKKQYYLFVLTLNIAGEKED